MRTYFVRPPLWARACYPSMMWKRDESSDPEHHLHLTIDDGPHPESTQGWLDLLDQIDQKATFFLLGEEALKHPQLVVKIRANGHQVASHGMHHLDGWKTQTDVYVHQVKQSLEVLDCTTYRPPYGRMRRSQQKQLSAHCDIVMWSLMPGDFDHRASETDISHRIRDRSATDIMVFHDSPESLAKVRNALLRLS